MTKRYVHRDKNTGKYAVSRGSWISYSGTLAEAKIYRNKQGGKSAHQGDYEWVEVELTVKPAETTLVQDEGGYELPISTRYMHTNIPIVEAYAFVQPWYDFDSCNDITPSDIHHAQGLVVMGWDIEDQAWCQVEHFETFQAATAIQYAEEYDLAMRSKLDVQPGTEGTFFDHHVTIWEDDRLAGLAIAEFDKSRARIAAQRKA